MIDPETVIDGRYRVISRVGSGGMADVYLAQDQLLGREVAVKVLHHHFAEDQEFVERFKREASSAAALSHPNIVGIFDRGEWNGTYYIAMEYVAGRSLKAIVRENGALDPVFAIDVVVQILRAAQFAHKRGVIHRDLKPHNVILDEEGRARVTDFGIARAGASDMTLTGSIMGTAQYLSPEQAQGYAVSAASDLYSVGVILYELLTGAVPFEGETAVAIAFKQVSAEPRPPSELNALLPHTLDAVVLRTLAKDPFQRYADAEELIGALMHEREMLPALTGAAVPLAGDGHRLAPPGDGPPTGAPLLLAPAAGYGEAYPPPAPEDGRRHWPWWLAAVLVLAAIAAAVLLLLLPAKGRLTVPNVTGQSQQSAVAELRHAGLQPVTGSASSATVASGLVISQSPPAGTALRSGGRVALTVSSGPASAGVTGVEGLSAAQAVAKLRAAGFKPVTRTQPDSSVAAGHVISTNPSAGTLAQLGSPVTVLVSSGPAPVKVPDVVGQSQSAAEATLTNAGLTVGAITPRVSSGQAPGTVIAQSPARGGSLPSGGAVELTVARASDEETVPNVVGQGEASAAAALGRAGFAPHANTTPTSEPSQAGVVLKQSPAGGRHAKKGSAVNITVGQLRTPTTPTTPTTPAGTTPAAPPAPAG